MSYQMELDRQYRNGREEGREEGMDNISKLLKLLVAEKKYDEIEKISEDKEFAEYYLLGTLLSTICVLMISII